MQAPMNYRFTRPGGEELLKIPAPPTAPRGFVALRARVLHTATRPRPQDRRRFLPPGQEQGVTGAHLECGDWSPLWDFGGPRPKIQKLGPVPALQGAACRAS